MALVRYRNIYSVILIFFWFSLFTYICVCVRYRAYLRDQNVNRNEDDIHSHIFGALKHEEDEESIGYDAIHKDASLDSEGRMPYLETETTRNEDQMALNTGHVIPNAAPIGQNVQDMRDVPVKPQILDRGNGFQDITFNQELKPQEPYPKQALFHSSPYQQSPFQEPPAQQQLVGSSGFDSVQNDSSITPNIINVEIPEASDFDIFRQTEEDSMSFGEEDPDDASDLVISEEQRNFDEQEFYQSQAVNPKLFSLSTTRHMIEHFQVKLPPLLPGYKNPCWLEDITEDYTYSDSYFNQCNVFPATGEQRFKAKFELFQKNVLRKRAKFGAHWRVRCFPYFFLLGVGKCGTTDLFITLKAYAKSLAPTFLKESHFWEWKRCHHTLHCRGRKRNPSFADYLDALDQPSERVRQEKVYNANGTEYHPLIIGDFTPSTLTFNPCWPRQPGNQGLDEPRFTTPHYIHSMRPQTKFIVIMRDPVERIFSNYKMKFRLSSHLKGENAQMFHDEMVNATTNLTECMRTKSARACAYSIMKFDFMTHVSNSMYEIYIRDWLNVFPREQFLFLRMEDYMENRVPNVKAILKFLNLDDLSPEQEVEVTAKQVSNQAPHTSDMFDVTREMLQNFFRPFNTRLAELLANDGFKWGY